MKSAISSHLDKFGILPITSFLTPRVKPTGTTWTE